MKHILTLTCLVLSLNSVVAVAAKDTSAITEQERTNVTNALIKLSKQLGKELKATNVQHSPIPGVLEVTVDASVFYLYGNKFALVGDLLNLDKNKDTWSLTEQALRQIRKKVLASIDPKDMIIYPATKNKIGTVTVFVDIDCTFCHKMEENIKEYNDLGIEIRYLAFPRTGPNTASYDKAITVWCSSDRQRDIAAAMEGKDLPKNLCAKNPVAQQLELGMKLGVAGTPTMFLDNGAKIPGLVEPKELAKVMKEQLN